MSVDANRMADPFKSKLRKRLANPQSRRRGKGFTRRANLI
jgi:hypothetical protein